MKRLLFGLLLPSMLLPAAVAGAQQGQAPASFAYNLKAGMGQGPTLDLSLAVTITSTAQDGTRRANIVVRMPRMPLDGKKVEATISPAGALMIASTGQFNTSPGMNPQSIKTNAEAATAPMLQNFIAPINSFASGCAKAPSQKPGATWHAYSKELNADVIYSISGREQHAGRDTLAITMKSASGASATVSGHGNYDPAAHLVVNVHSEVIQSVDPSATQVLDAALASSP